MFRKKAIALLLAALLLLLACACAAPAEDAAPNTVTDQAGRAVAIKGPVDRIVSGYYISTSVCIALGLGDRLVAIEAKAASRPIYALAAPALLRLPDVGTAKDFNLEACLALRPDLVILPWRLRETADILAQMGIPAIVVDPESRDRLLEMITLLGDAAGVPERAARLRGHCRASIVLTEAWAKYIHEKPSVYMAGVGSYLSAAPLGMYQSTLTELAGGTNAVDVEGNGWMEISYEQLLAMNPDVIILPAEAGYSKDDIASDPQLKSLDAVKNGRIFKMPGSIEAWDSPLPSSILGARWLLSALHGDIFPLDELHAEAAAFYNEFYDMNIMADEIELGLNQ